MLIPQTNTTTKLKLMNIIKEYENCFFLKKKIQNQNQTVPECNTDINMRLQSEIAGSLYLRINDDRIHICHMSYMK